VGAIFYVFGAYSKAAAVSLFLFQSVCSALIAVCLANLGSRLLGRTTGMTAGLIWAFYPTSIFYSAVRIWYCELALLLLLLLITLALTSRDAISSRQVALLGALSGLTVLTDSTLVLYLPLLLLWMLIARRVQLTRLMFLVVLWGITAGLITSPWMIRNWVVLDSPRLGKSNLGQELFTGNSSFSSGTNDRTEMAQAFAALDQKELAYYQGHSELAYNQYLQNKALEWIKANPSRFLSLTARRIWYFWVVNPSLGSESWLRLIYFGPFLILALYGLCYEIRRWWQLAPIWFFLLLYPLPYYLTHVARGRYSYPVEPLVVLLASIPVSLWLRKYAPFVLSGIDAKKEDESVSERIPLKSRL
jgi:4-amino-4-deoxy-L-arabinose transferase-like glycosyltransferase